MVLSLATSAQVRHNPMHAMHFETNARNVMVRINSACIGATEADCV
jgi:hypothetical protein